MLRLGRFLYCKLRFHKQAFLRAEQSNSYLQRRTSYFLTIVGLLCIAEICAFFGTRIVHNNVCSLFIVFGRYVHLILWVKPKWIEFNNARVAHLLLICIDFVCQLLFKRQLEIIEVVVIQQVVCCRSFAWVKSKTFSCKWNGCVVKAIESLV